MEKEVVSKECRFALHLPKNEDREDTHLIKEHIVYSDGSTHDELRVVTNFQRPYYITKEPYRKNKQKKPSELLERVNEFYSTESDLAINIAKRLPGVRRTGKVPTMFDLVDSPYLYGTTIKTPALIKKAYQNKYPDVSTPYRIGIFDIETNIETEQIVIASLCLENTVYVVALKDIFLSKVNIENQVKYLYDNYIPKTPISEKIKLVFHSAQDEEELLFWIFNQAHTEQPDLVYVWNIDYDIPHIVKRCEKLGIDVKQLFSDPKLPKELWHFKYIEDSKNKVTASGVFKPKDVQERWNIVHASSSFYWIDAMSAYHFIRQGSKTVPGGYSLDNILKTELGDSFKKLKFKDLEEIDITGAEWHTYMLKNRPVHYIIYNIWDTMSILHLDDKTKDYTINLPLLSGASSFDIFHQNPKKIMDAFHFVYLENGSVLGVKGRNDDTNDLLGLKNWIVTLPISRVSDNGLKVIEEDPNLVTNVRALVYDSDQHMNLRSNHVL